MSIAKNVMLASFLFLFLVNIAGAGPLKPSMIWKGSVADEKLVSEKPENGVITNAKAFEKLVKAWSVADKVPQVNFDKELILVETTVGSVLNLNADLEPSGNLKVLGFGTADFGPGFRYVIISVPRDGVKTVNGKALPK
jgi:hypothetical protein